MSRVTHVTRYREIYIIGFGFVSRKIVQRGFSVRKVKRFVVCRKHSLFHFNLLCKLHVAYCSGL